MKGREQRRKQKTRYTHNFHIADFVHDEKRHVNSVSVFNKDDLIGHDMKGI